MCGVIESYELEFEHDNFVPLLLSLPNQATLGLMKDMRNGTAFLKDYQVEIELCKAKQNNLLCINIGALGEALKFREKLPRNLRPLRIGSEDWLETFSGGKRKCLMPPPAASSVAMTSTTTTSEDKKMRRTDSERKEFDRFVERDPSTWSREEIERFHDMEDKAFGNVYHTESSEYDTWSPPSSPGADLNDLAQASEEAAMVAHGRPEDDEVKKSGGGWKDNPPIKKPSDDLLRHVYIVCCGLDFEMTRYGKQRNGHGSTLQMNQMWWHNYLKKHGPAGDPEWRNVPLAQDTEESKAATTCLVDTLEWHLNSINKKATHTVWRHKPEDTVCSVLDCRTENLEYDDPHPGGGEKGAKNILKDKELHQRIEQLGRQIKEFTRRKDYAGKNMVIVFVGHGLGLGPETRIARAIHTWTAMKWSDKSRVRLFNFAKEDFPSFCASGRCAECDRSNTGFYHQGILKLVGQKLGLPDDCDEWGRQTYEKEEDEAREKREARERRRQEREIERKEKERHEEKEKSRGRERDKAGEKPGRERSRSGKRQLKSQARPDDATEALEFVTRLNEVNLRKLCQGLKACGMLEDGINYLYQEGTPMEQAKKVVKILQLGPRTISSLAEVEFKKPSPTDASGSRTKPPEPMGPPPGREKTEKSSSKKAVDVKTPEEQMEAHKQKMKQELLEAKEAKRRRREKEEKRDSLSESYSEEEEVIEEDPPKAPGAIVLKENPRKDEGKDDEPDMPEESYDEGQSWHDLYDWNEDDWQDRESRDYERERSQRRSKGYEKGKGKGRGKSKSKGKDKGKKGSYKGWWSPPKISEKDLMATLLKKANRHQAEWQELPRNKLTWETLKSEEGDELISVRICVKKSPRHTLMNVPPECRHWRKFSVMLPSIDEPWEECEKDAQAHDIEEFDDDKKPLLFMACLITKSCILSPEDVEEEEERTEESRTREYNSLGEVKNASAFYATSTMNAVSANLCNEGICQMFVENDLIRSSFTGDGKTAERYMALAAAAGTGELTGRKCKTWTHSNKSNLGVLICLGCKTSLAPAGHEVMNDLESPGKMLKKLDAEYYPQATVILGEQVDEERMKEVIITLNTKGGSLTVVTPQFGFQDTVLRTVGLDVWHGPGDINIYGNAEWLNEWASRKDRYHAPMTAVDALNDLGFQMALEKQLDQQTCIEHAFPAEDEAERVEELGTLDDPEFEEQPQEVQQVQQEMPGPTDVEKMFDEEGEMLDEIPLPNLPKDERERREQWLQLPRATRIAVRRLHRQFGHVPNRVLVQILRASGAKPDYIKAARTLRCEGCDSVQPKPQTQKVTLPRSLSFNDAVGVDIFEVKDANGERYSVFSMVDQGTCFHQATVVKVGGSQATSRECLKAFQSSWMSWAGPPREVVSDRGLHNRGEFSKELSSMGCQITQIGVESPEQIGRTERHGGLLKAMVIRVIAELQLVGKDAVQHVLTQSVMTKNSMSRVTGFAPSQWVLGKLPKEAGSIMDEENWADLGALTAADDPTLEFGQIARIREKARKAFVRADMSSRVRRAILRKSAPISKEYGVGDLVCFRTDQLGWSTVSRIIGFDGPKVVWVLCKGTPACVALDRLRPVNAAEALAHQFLAGQKPFVFGSGQQGFIDVDRELPTVPEAEGEEEEDSRSEGGDPIPPTPAPRQERLPQDIPIERNIFSDDSDEDMDRETTGEPEMEHIPSSRRRSADSTSEGPLTSRRRISSSGLSPTESRATESRASRPADEGSPLTEVWRRTGTTGSGVDMAERGYDQTNLATEENQDEWHYDEKMGVLIREHKTPRIALFSLENVTDCPVPVESLTKGRITEVDYLEGKSTVMQDSWQNDYGVKMLGREWTGKTIFLAQSRKKEERPKVDDEVFAFIAARFDAVVSKNSKKKERGKVFDFDKCDEKTQNGIIGSRTTEWLKWKKFLAAQVVAGKELQDLLKEGHKPVPTQWIDTDKNEHLKREGQHHEILHKSRLVARGDLEQSHEEIRTDSPTVETEALNIILAWTASFSLRIKSIDITNAYFHGEKMDKLMLLRLPRGGLPDPEIPDGAMMLARVPIYGTKDAGRRFWLKLKGTIVNIGMKQNSQCPALFTYSEDGDIKVMMGTHVDDILFSCKPGYEQFVQKIQEAFQVEDSKVSEGEFRFCGREIAQGEDGSIKVTCKSTAEKIEPISYRTGVRKTELANDAEKSQLRSVVGSLAWVARQARPDLSYRVNKLQSVCTKATLKDLVFANKTVADAKEFSNHGIFYQAGILDFNNCILCTISDASWSNEKQLVKGKLEPLRSQRARMTVLAHKDFLKGMETPFYPIAWQSTMVKRVCRSTLQAESYGMTAAVEEGMRLRAMLVDARGLLDRRKWERSSRGQMQHLWLTDCKSLEDDLLSDSLTKTDDKRLSVDIAALRQLIWQNADEEDQEELSAELPDQIRWIDTSKMLVDCLTKDMKTNYLRDTLKSGTYNIVPTAESEVTKLAKQKYRRMKSQSLEQAVEVEEDVEND